MHAQELIQKLGFASIYQSCNGQAEPSAHRHIRGYQISHLSREKYPLGPPDWLQTPASGRRAKISKGEETHLLSSHWRRLGSKTRATVKGEN